LITLDINIPATQLPTS